MSEVLVGTETDANKLRLTFTRWTQNIIPAKVMLLCVRYAAIYTLDALPLFPAFLFDFLCGTASVFFPSCQRVSFHNDLISEKRRTHPTLPELRISHFPTPPWMGWLTKRPELRVCPLYRRDHCTTGGSPALKMVLRRPRKHLTDWKSNFVPCRVVAQEVRHAAPYAQWESESLSRPSECIL